MARTNPNLVPFWREVLAPDVRYAVLYGGRDSSKTWDAAAMAIALSTAGKLRIVCTRQIQARIEDSVYTTLKIQIERLGLQGHFKILQNKIICTLTGSEFLFYGLCRSITDVKGLEGIDILWNEEAEDYSKEQHDILAPTLRKEGSMIWFVFNPRIATDFVYKNFVIDPPSNAVVRKINYDENPYLSATSLEGIEEWKIRDFEGYQHVYLGIPKDNDDSAVIKRTHCMAAIDAHVNLGIEIRGEHRLGFDVADSGQDLCAIVYNHGPLAKWSDMWKASEDELPKSVKRTVEAARARDASIIYDAIGVGAFVGGMVNELNRAADTYPVRHSGFFAGGGVDEPGKDYKDTRIKNSDYFSNVKAQKWWDVADRLSNTCQAVRDGRKFADSDMIFISSDIPNLDRLIDELCTPARDFDRAGRVKVEGKDDLAKRGIRSPNLADAFIMANGRHKRSLSDIFGNR